MRICFLAPSCYGKSTAVRYLESKYNVINIKIATPLYELQDMFYKYINKEMKGKQDGELLQFLGYKIRKENPDFLKNSFIEKLNSLESKIIVNDDARPFDYEFLKDLGFIFIKINGFKRERCDHTKSDDKKSIEWQEEIPFDYELDNYGSLEEFYENIDKLMEVINDRKVLHYTSRKSM